MTVLEVWKDIDGYNGWYQVSNLGRVRSLDRIIKYKSGKMVPQKGHELKPQINRKGYLYVNLSTPELGSKIKTIHRLVAISFIQNPENKPQVNHKRGNKLDNSVDNLEWATVKENHDHATITGLKPFGSRIYQAKLTDKLVEEMKIRHKNGEQIKELAAEIGIRSENLSKAIRGITWKHLNLETYITNLKAKQ